MPRGRRLFHFPRLTLEPRAFPHIYFAFAAGYLLSYLYRTVNAVISPELVRDLALNPSSLGLLTSAYFLAFAAMQVPVGVLLDRFGPRRVEPVLLAIAASGAALFAFAESLAGLAVARAVIGAGVCACLMAPLKAIISWYPADRQASYASWIMVAGGIGALAATVPLELALRVAHWRTVFVALALVTLVVALAIWWRVPDIAKPERSASIGAQFAAVRTVAAHARFWWIAPLGDLRHGLVHGDSGTVGGALVDGGRQRHTRERCQSPARDERGHHGRLRGAWRLRHVALRGGASMSRHLVAAGFALSGVALMLIVLEVPGSYLWWSLYGLGAAANVLAFPVLNEGFGREMSGRTNTTLNLSMFVGSFAAQWGIGIVVDLVRTMFAFDEAGGLRVAFAVIVVGNVATYAWFAYGWKRHRLHTSVAATA